MRLAVKLSLSAEHSRAFNKRTCGNVVRIPERANPSRYPPGQLAILELDQFSSAQMISTTDRYPVARRVDPLPQKLPLCPAA